MVVSLPVNGPRPGVVRSPGDIRQSTRRLSASSSVQVARYGASGSGWGDAADQVRPEFGAVGIVRPGEDKSFSAFCLLILVLGACAHAQQFRQGRTPRHSRCDGHTAAGRAARSCCQGCAAALWRSGCVWGGLWRGCGHGACQRRPVRGGSVFGKWGARWRWVRIV